MKEKEQELNDQLGNILQDKTEEIVRMEDIPGTPFKTVTVIDKGTFVALGQLRLTEYLPSKEFAEQVVYDSEWDFTIAVMIGLIKLLEDKQLEVEITRLTEGS